MEAEIFPALFLPRISVFVFVVFKDNLIIDRLTKSLSYRDEYLV